MTTLKDYLRSMGLRSGMEGSGPSTSTSIALADNTDGFVPPCDGYLHFRGELDSLDKWLAVFQLDYGRSYDIAGTSPLEDVVRVRKGIPVRFSSKEGMKIKELKFFKCIGGGHSRYLPTLSCNRFGGALWLRLKTTSETLQKQEACLPLRREGGFLTRPLSTRVMKRGDTKPLLQSASSLSNLSTQTSVTGISKTRLHTPILAGQLSASAQERATCPVTRAMQSRTTLGAQADKPQTQVPLRSTSFLLSVASNNARMEVAA